MEKIITSPRVYVQNENALSELAKYVQPLGSKILAIADAFVTGLVGETVAASFNDTNVSLVYEEFGGECSQVEIDRLAELVKQHQADVIVGIGGGKTLDTAKAVAHYTHCAVVIAPTVASSDAPTSAVSVIYTEEGEFSEYLVSRNPDVVVMDTSVIAKAPVRLLVAGMGDALATHFEARANERNYKRIATGAFPTLAAQALAKLSYDVLLRDGLKAKLSAEHGQNSLALENIIEANTYLSGLGFESGGVAAAHAIHNGFTILPQCHHLLHGEKVAFGTLALLVLENAPMEEINQVMDLCQTVGLPITLNQMGIEKVDVDELLEVAKIACLPQETIHFMPFEVTPEAVVSALLIVHQLGIQRLEK